MSFFDEFQKFITPWQEGVIPQEDNNDQKIRDTETPNFGRIAKPENGLRVIRPYDLELEYDESLPEGWSIQTYDIYDNDFDYNPANDPTNPYQRFAKYIWPGLVDNFDEQWEHYANGEPIDTITIYTDYGGNVRKVESKDFNEEYGASDEYSFPQDLQDYMDSYANNNKYAMVFRGKRQNGFRKRQPRA